jgi:UPF0271 protein
MKVVLDTSAIIYLNDFRNFDEILTVSEVVQEVKDRITSMKLSSLNIKILEPSDFAMKEIEETARKTGDLEKLSKTDLKILSLAKENNCTIISDDRNIQNVAEKIGIEYISTFNKKITKLITWKKFCKNCQKYYDEGSVCDVCGSKLMRIPVNAKDVT